MEFLNDSLKDFLLPDLFKKCSEPGVYYTFKNATIINNSITGCLGDFIVTQLIIPCENFLIKEKEDFFNYSNFKSFINLHFKENPLYKIIKFNVNCDVISIEKLDYYSGICIFLKSRSKNENKFIEIFFIKAKKEENVFIELNKNICQIINDKYSINNFELILSKMLPLIGKFTEYCIGVYPITRHYTFLLQYFKQIHLNELGELVLIDNYIIPFNDPNHEKLVNKKENWKKKYDKYYPGLLDLDEEIPIYNESLFKEVNKEIDLSSLVVSFFSNKRFEKEGISYTFSNDSLYIYSGVLFKFLCENKLKEVHFYFVQDNYTPRNDYYFSIENDYKYF